MSRRKNGFTREQHERAGLELCRMYARFQNLHCCISRAYPKNSKVSRLAGRICDNMGLLRSLLDDALCREDRDNFDTHVYYPGRDARGKTSCIENPLTYQEMDEQALIQRVLSTPGPPKTLEQFLEKPHISDCLRKQARKMLAARAGTM